jgi:hypothetical protein
VNSCLFDGPGKGGNSVVGFDCSLDVGSGSRECRKRGQLACL